MLIDPGVLTLVQTTFLQHISATFSITASYALRLLYIFATLEVVIFGLVWALAQDVNWGRLFFKVIKIGLIFFIIENFPWILNSIVSSFAALSGITLSGVKVAQFIFNPALIWQYGYDAGLHLLQASTISNNFGMVLIQVILGFSMLLVFGLIGIQIVLQVIIFYLVSFTGLILLPFGTFSASYKMFDKSVQAVLKAGVRLMVLVIIIGVGVAIWNTFNLADLSAGQIKISQPLGLFFTALLFLYLSIKAPGIVAETVGEISSNIFGEGGQTRAVEVARETSVATASMGPMVDFQAATAIEAGNFIPSATPVAVGEAAGGVSAVVSGGTAVAPSAYGKNNLAEESLVSATSGVKSISEKTVRKIKDAVTQAIKSDQS